MLFPLFTFPYLARNLSKSGFALVILVQSISIFASLFIEYGFNYTATRDIALVSGDRKAEKKIFSVITSSKLPLSILAAVAIMVYGILSNKTSVVTLVALIAMTISQGMLPIWYFQGISNLKLSAISEIVSKSVNLILMLVIVRSEDRGEAYLLSLACISLSSSIFQNTMIYRKLGFESVSVSDIVLTLRNSFTLFAFRIGSSLYTSGSMVLLGSIVSPSSFAVYAGSDRIFRSAAALTGPLGDAFFPRISAAETSNPVEAKRLKKTASMVLICFSLVIYAILFIFADFWINLLLGPKYLDSVSVFKILVADIPLIAVGTILGIFELLPKKLDLYFTISVTVAGIWSLFSIYVLVPRLGLEWMAYTVLIAETLVICICAVSLVIYRRKHA